ncbi:uncharacterized protein KY384_006288 [Bacidia gigantensis]|uniref:uncharacterized protein n=1 Tax=Bacidia gigantensis TaxID=2732470 RepID=UPI001D054009|nr:uncharacterized protein KY384_006288 [Bacidia gigantensis]KAG8528601.1 hypothetical protein KY384_006288 [Bacidia gigantensis]
MSATTDQSQSAATQQPVHQQSVQEYAANEKSAPLQPAQKQDESLPQEVKNFLDDLEHLRDRYCPKTAKGAEYYVLALIMLPILAKVIGSAGDIALHLLLATMWFSMGLGLYAAYLILTKPLVLLVLIGVVLGYVYKKEKVEMKGDVKEDAKVVVKEGVKTE